MVEAAIAPQNPAMHEQPFGTLLPVEFVGHDTAENKIQPPTLNTPRMETARRKHTERTRNEHMHANYAGKPMARAEHLRMCSNRRELMLYPQHCPRTQRYKSSPSPRWCRPSLRDRRRRCRSASRRQACPPRRCRRQSPPACIHCCRSVCRSHQSPSSSTACRSPPPWRAL